MAARTRLGYEGYGVRRAGSFAGKTGATPPASGPHPVGKITRLGLDGYGVRRGLAGGFSGKTPADPGSGAPSPRLLMMLGVGT